VVNSKYHIPCWKGYDILFSASYGSLAMNWCSWGVPPIQRLVTWFWLRGVLAHTLLHW